MDAVSVSFAGDSSEGVSDSSVAFSTVSLVVMSHKVASRA